MSRSKIIFLYESKIQFDITTVYFLDYIIFTYRMLKQVNFKFNYNRKIHFDRASINKMFIALIFSIKKKQFD